MVPGGDKEDFGGDPADLQNTPGNRLGSTGTFVVLRGGVERTQDLPKGFSLSLKGDGQLASEPLIPAEEYFAGGVDAVRGYLESEELGDDAIHGTVELFTPTLPALLPDPIKDNLRFTVFFDGAYLWVKQTPPGQKDHHQLSGTGFGARVKLTDYIQGRVDFAWALNDAAITQKGDLFVHFSVKGSF
jgi:hemolysin activation/secretion protein